MSIYIYVYIYVYVYVYVCMYVCMYVYDLRHNTNVRNFVTTARIILNPEALQDHINKGYKYICICIHTYLHTHTHT